jgi:predicted RNase H-like nuclease (RuvC/YqgF family)
VWGGISGLKTRIFSNSKEMVAGKIISENIVVEAEAVDQITKQQEVVDQHSQRLMLIESQYSTIDNLREQVLRLENESLLLLRCIPNLQHRVVDSEKQINKLQGEREAQETRIKSACSAHWCPYTKLWRPYFQPYVNWKLGAITGLAVGFGVWKTR